MKHNEIFPPDTIDEQIERSLATSLREVVSPEIEVMHRLSALYEDNKRSTHRVEQRLAQHLARHHAASRSGASALTLIPKTRETSKPAPPSREAVRRGASGLMLVAATLVVCCLVASLVLVLQLAPRAAKQPTRVAGGQMVSPPGLYMSLSNDVSRLDARTHKVIWRTHLTNLFGEPIVLGDTVYVRSASDGTLIALDAQTGARRWSQTTTGGRLSLLFQAGSPLFMDHGQLYVASSVLSELNPANGSIIARYTPLRGQRVWRFLTVMDSVLYYQSGSSISAVQLPGEKLLWQEPLNSKLLVEGLLVQSGVVYVQGVTGAQQDQGVIETFDAQSGSALWQSPTIASSLRTLIVTPDRIYAASVSNGLLVFDTHTHVLVWQKPFDTGSMLVSAGTLYLDDLRFRGARSEISAYETFVALNANSGKILWQKENENNGGVDLIGTSGGVFFGVGWGGDGQKGTVYAISANGTLLWIMPIDISPSQWGGITAV